MFSCLGQLTEACPAGLQYVFLHLRPVQALAQSTPCRLHSCTVSSECACQLTQSAPLLKSGLNPTSTKAQCEVMLLSTLACADAGLQICNLSPTPEPKEMTPAPEACAAEASTEACKTPDLTITGGHSGPLQ
jgi:hypothetical protein